MAVQLTPRAGIATGGTIEESKFEFLWGQEFSYLNVIQTGSRTHPASYPTGTVGSFPGVKASRARS
jgi:hypothetical protein